MACSKRRKVDDENRSFKEEWIQQYAFTLPTTSSKPICLICSETVALVKSSNLKRHYETKHSGFEKMYQQGTEERKNKINKLKSQYERSTIVLASTMTAQERAVECSLRIAWILGKHKKPFADAEVVKECMLETVDTLFDGRQKNEIKDKIKQIPLSDSTSMRRTELLANDLMLQLDLGLKEAPCISLAIDESTDSTDHAQLMVFVRYYDARKKEFCQDLLGVTDLKGRTREDIYGALKGMLESRNIDVKSIFSLTTDGAPAMVGREKGLVARLKEDNADMITYHCIIHQSVLCASLGDEYKEVMETIMKLVNFLRSTSALQHRLLRTFLTEVNASHDDLLVHNNKKLDLFKTDIQSQLLHFPRLLEQHNDETGTNHVQFIENLINNFKNVKLKQILCDCSPETFWSKEGSPANFPTLHRLAVQILTMFGSTYTSGTSTAEQFDMRFYVHIKQNVGDLST
ncbi:protein FAM200B-like [Penaeus chinensis]|uniref:protein FAM200B-like n=1 Tax=Penaeus chinensis TaxID=139456 RepID=UPI001FB5E96A|nr:protein FAM200B-like [Penaeus chinensis]